MDLVADGELVRICSFVSINCLNLTSSFLMSTSLNSIMDGLLDGPERSIASKLLYPKLSEHITFLSTERVGRHTVEKLFLALPTMEDKAALSAQLSHSLSRLGSNAMGRSVMASCAVKEYLEGESSWKEAVARQRENENWLDEILGEQKEVDSGDEGGGEDRMNKRRKKEKKKKRCRQL